MTGGGPDGVSGSWVPLPLPDDDVLAGEPAPVVEPIELEPIELEPPAPALPTPAEAAEQPTEVPSAPTDPVEDGHGAQPTTDPGPDPDPEPDPDPDRSAGSEPLADAAPGASLDAATVAALLRTDVPTGQRRSPRRSGEQNLTGLVAFAVLGAATVLLPLQVIVHRAFGPVLVALVSSALVLATAPGVLQSAGRRGRVPLVPALLSALGVLGILGCFVAALVAA